MNKKAAMGLGVAAALLAVLSLSVMATDWDVFDLNESPESIDFTGEMIEVVNDDGEPILDADGETQYAMNENSLNFALFEGYGPLMLILALLMFGAMIGGVCIAREESEHDDTD